MMGAGEIVVAVVIGGRVRLTRLACQATSWMEMPASSTRSQAAIGRLRPHVVLFRRDEEGAGELAASLSQLTGSTAPVIAIEAEWQLAQEGAADSAALMRALMARLSSEPAPAQTTTRDQAISEDARAADDGPATSLVPETVESQEPVPPGDAQPTPEPSPGHAVTECATTAAARAARLTRLLRIPLPAGGESAG